MTDPKNTQKKPESSQLPDISDHTEINVLSREALSESNQISVPKIELPRGGGALQGIDEKFKVNSANGTATMGVPFPLTPSRQGFQPSLSLNYNSGGGNGVFGLGWSMDLMSITRKTDKGIPRYTSEDIFLFSGAEDLIPFLQESAPGTWEPVIHQHGDYTIARYRPRITSDHSRIEKIHHPVHGTYWKVTTSSNVVTIYGRDPGARIQDPDYPEKIFTWLPEFSYDDKGNWIRYAYKAENLEGVDHSPEEHHRISGLQAFSNRYLKRVEYGNATPYQPDPSTPYDPASPSADQCYFELVLDYGEHDADQPLPTETPGMSWLKRDDAFSTYRSGFEIRTYRLCQRMLMFHHFPGEKNQDGSEFGENYLVRSLELHYQDSSINNSGQAEVNYLQSVISSGYVRKADGTYSKKSLPPLTMEYQQLVWDPAVRQMSPEELENMPEGIGGNYQWVDLYGEGINGLLTEQGNSWFYKENLGDTDGDGNVQFGSSRLVNPKPVYSGLNAEVMLTDLDADGLKELVTLNGGVQGFFSMGTSGQWNDFSPFKETVNVDRQDPNVRVFDITGDGKPDLVMTEERIFTYYESKGKEGYAVHKRALKSLDEQRGPAIVFSDAHNKIMLADMTGDGLTDIVRIRNGSVHYWPNMGYGRFGARVSMGNAPQFDLPDQFNSDYIHLADISGTGPSDIIYRGKGKFQAYLNLSGNKLSDVHELDPSFPMDNMIRFQVTDLMGTGTACLVWSSGLPADSQRPMRYIDLMGSKKPHLLVAYENGMGLRTTLHYRSSTHFYLKDKRSGTPWITRLPFPVQVVEKTVQEEFISDVRFSSRYMYHHGFYDHHEREFRGFGMVEQLDSEFYTCWKDENADNALEKQEETFQPPVLTRTWYHTGAYLRKNMILDYFKGEYWPARYEARFPGELGPLHEPDLPDAQLAASELIQDPVALESLTGEERREAVRACKGMVLRTEIFDLKAEDPENPAADELRRQMRPYSVAAHNCRIILQQPKEANKHACFQVLESESFSIHYEQDITDPRITHSLNLETDRYGNILQQVSVAYARLAPDGNLPAFVQQEQARTHITLTRNTYTNDVIMPVSYRIRQSCATETFELRNIVRSADFYQPDDFEDVLGAATTEIPYLQPHSNTPERRKIEDIRSLYLRNDLSGPLPFGSLESRGMSYESYALAFTPDMLTQLYPPGFVPAAGYPGSDAHFVHFEGDADWWVPSGTSLYLEGAETVSDAAVRFYQPIGYRDAGGSEVRLTYYKNYFFLQESTTDDLGNTIRAESFNFRTLSPAMVRDANETLHAAVADELGLVKATALLGKDLDQDGGVEMQRADDLAGLNEWSDDEEADILDFFSEENATAIDARAMALLGNATMRYVYNQGAWTTAQKPAAACSIQRETHAADVAPGGTVELQISFEYTGGAGNVVMVKKKAEPGPALKTTVNADDTYVVNQVDTTPEIRWLGNGRRVFNNKGNMVREYQPYFSVTPVFEDAPELVETGVTFTLYYDSLGRHTRTLFPDLAEQKIHYNAWKKEIWDQNDMVLQSEWYTNRFNRLIDAELIADGKDPVKEESAAAKTGAHDATPSVVYFDTLGRPIMTEAHNILPDTSDEFIRTSVSLDIEGNTREVVDARGNTVMTYRQNMLGRRVQSWSMDAGERWHFYNALGKLTRSLDERNHTVLISYDVLHRETEKRVTGGDGVVPLNHLFEKIIYGEGAPNDKQLNLRGKVFVHYDTAGKVESREFDQKGNLLSQVRWFSQEYKAVPDWNVGNPDALLIAGPGNQTDMAYDAVNRLTSKMQPDGSQVTNRYNAAGLLEQVELRRNGASEIYVRNIDYNEKGQRKSILYGNDVKTSYVYDRETFRLLSITTRRQNNDLLQELHYTYDAVGNITETEDRAIPDRFFANQQIQPRNRYTYDAVYRLIEAQGKEHVGQVNYDACDNWNDLPFLKQYNPNDQMPWRNFTERYRYDVVGNILEMRHIANGGSWTRTYQYEAASNRLTQTQVGANTYHYTHHPAHGFLTDLPHLDTMQWNFRDELVSTSQMRSCTGNNPETTYYVYNGSGRRVRKVTELPAAGGGPPTIKEDRQYLGDFERYRKLHGNHAGLERTTLHISDDHGRMAMIDERNGVDDGTDPETIRYQVGNRSGSAHLELNHAGEVISYEEFHPYGTTAYQAVSATIKAAAKRYRYTSMERDNETGLEYHNARYYIPWLGRWLKPDPGELSDGINVYLYSRDNPVNRSDISGLLSWGQVFGIAAAVVVGTVVTVATAGLAGPVVGTAAAAVIGGIVGGAAGAATGEVVEAVVDGRPVTAENVGRAALIGGAVGGVFAGAGVGVRAALNTEVGRRVVSSVASSRVGQAALRGGYRVAASGVGNAYRTVSEAIRRNVQRPAEEAGERIATSLGQQMERSSIDSVSRAGANMTGRAAESRAARQTVDQVLDDIAPEPNQSQSGRTRGAIRGQIDGEEIAASTRSGSSGSTRGQGSIQNPETGETIAAAPGPGDTPLESFMFRSSSGYTAQAGFHAEIKLLGFSFLRAGSNPSSATGRLYIGASNPFCNSCTAGIAQTRALLPGVDVLSVHASYPIGAAVGPVAPSLLPDDQSRIAPEGRMLQLQVDF